MRVTLHSASTTISFKQKRTLDKFRFSSIVYREACALPERCAAELASLIDRIKIDSKLTQFFETGIVSSGDTLDPEAARRAG